MKISALKLVSAFRSTPVLVLAALTLILVGAIMPITSQATTIVGPWVPRFKSIDYSVSTNIPSADGFPNRHVVYALRVDLADPDVRLFSTPRITNYIQNARESAGYTVSDFLRNNHLQAAINANFFDPGQYYLPPGTAMVISGLAISEGTVVSEQEGPQYSAAVVFDEANRGKIIHTNWPAASMDGLYTAVSGTYPLLVSGVNIGYRYLSDPDFLHRANPRTAFGLSQDGRYLYLLAIDGRQRGYSDGAYDYETAGWLQLLGAYDGINMDGGGSTTLVVEDSTGAPIELNHPSAVADSGRERTVGSHFGVFAKPLRGFINDVTVVPDDTSATISWTTVEPASAQVEYDTTTAFTQSTALQSALATSHSVQLTGLTPNTGYYYRVLAETETERHVSVNFRFTTTNYVTTNTVFDLTHSWKFVAGPTTDSQWTGLNYDDSSWSGPGAGLLWVDSRAGGVNSTVQQRNTQMPTDPSNNGFPYRAYYLRTHFTLDRLVAGSSLGFSAFVDDGAVFYINGREIFRLRMPAGAIDSRTLAVGYPCAGDATCPDVFGVATEAIPELAAGENVLAVEVHNYNAQSPDISFGLALSVVEPIVRVPKLNILMAGDTITLSWDRAGFFLEWSESPSGPWTGIGGDLPSPYMIDPKLGSTRFYRLRK